MATSIRLDAEIEKRLDHLAAATGHTKAYYLRELVTNGLEDLEDFYLASVTMERVRKGQAPAPSIEGATRSRRGPAPSDSHSGSGCARPGLRSMGCWPKPRPGFRQPVGVADG